jgi:vacuolar-type H+-ATPase subunit E/Vma4
VRTRVEAEEESIREVTQETEDVLGLLEGPALLESVAEVLKILLKEAAETVQSKEPAAVAGIDPNVSMRLTWLFPT